MARAAVVALALLESANAFQAPAMKAATRSVGATMFSEGDIGVTRPLGVYDPLGLIETRDMRRYEIMEIKHGRAAMLGFLHVIALKSGIVLPGYLSTSQDPAKAPGDIGGETWTRYDDKATKTFKLNAERNNGRAAMLGITGCLIHELLGVNALYPTGGMGGDAPPTIY